MTAALMIQGTGSDTGKSLLVAGLCRLFADRGLRVRPFKPQNMSNNAAASPGGEIGRAQALQARAARVEPHPDMNPVLLKPEGAEGAQVILQGRRLATVRARDYAGLKPQLLPKVMESFHRLGTGADLVLVEGAGSPAEVNLRSGDIANMGFAEAADLPVILAGDIDRGGVIAQIAGTALVLPPADRARIRGFIINKFRGDPALFAEGLRQAEQHSGWPALGLVPWFGAAARLPAEDSLGLSGGRHAGPLKIAVPVLPGIANFDDLDPLRAEPSVSLLLVHPGTALPGDAALVLLPGNKSTIAGLAAFRAAGWDIDLSAHIRRGGQVLGLCGGYQMLGRTIADPEGLEGPAATVPGLGHLDIETIMSPAKRVTEIAGTTGDGTPVRGYEIHIGTTTGPGCSRPWLRLDGRPEGAVSASGLVRGTYLHGLFAGDDFRHAYLAGFGQRSVLAYEAAIEQVLDDLARHLAAHLDIERILALARA